MFNPLSSPSVPFLTQTDHGRLLHSLHMHGLTTVQKAFIHSLYRLSVSKVQVVNSIPYTQILQAV